MPVSQDLKLTPNALQVLEKRYLLKDDKGRLVETPEELFRRVANAVAGVEAGGGKRRSSNARSRKKGKAKTEGRSGKRAEKWAEAFFDMMIHRRFLPNSPTLMNAGKERGQLAACFVLPIEDSLDSIFETLKNAAKIHQSGGGTGFAFSRIRPRGSIVRSTHGVASGPVSFMHIYDIATETIKQGGTRRGANMAILRVDHPDIFEFVDAKLDQKSIANFNISVGATDEFMNAVREGREFWLKDHLGARVRAVKARELFDRIVSAAWMCGDPGVVFLDRMNLFNPTPHVGSFESTNPCVAGDVRVQVKGKGLIPIEELVGGTPSIATELDGRASYRRTTQVVCTGVRPVFRLCTREGYELKLTEDHRVSTQRGDIPAGELVYGDQIHLAEVTAPEVDWESFECRLGEILGWLTGDGHFTHHGNGQRVVVLCFYGEDKQEVAPRFLATVRTIINAPTLTLNELGSKDMNYIRSTRLNAAFLELGITVDCKKRIPECLWRGSQEFQVGYLRGLFSADGSVQGSVEKGLSIRLASNQLELLQDVQRLLLVFGIQSTIYKNRRVEQLRWMPDSSRKLKEYLCGAQHELAISKRSLVTFATQIGFLIQAKQKKVDLALSQYGRRGPYKDSFCATFDQLLFVGEEEVYDLTEPDTHHFYANGILVHNCGEQPLLPFESCNLGSLNLGAYFQMGSKEKFNWELFRKDIETATRFLDNVIDLNDYPVPECKQITLRDRKIGLGVMGFADLLLMMGIPYTAPEALELGERLMSFVDHEAKKASRALAKERGPFPNWKNSLWDKLGYPPMRNATVTTVAPTGTISVIAGASSGIEPIFAGVFLRNVLDGARLVDIHPAVEKLMKEGTGGGSGGGEGSAALTDEMIAKKLGPAWTPSKDVPVEVHVKMQAVFQRFSDSAVSKTINLPADATEADVAKAYVLAYDSGCKGITVYRDKSKPTQVLEHGPPSEGKDPDAECLIC